LWIILTFGYVHFPILFEVVGFFLVAKHKATFSWELAPRGSGSSRQCSAGVDATGVRGVTNGVVTGGDKSSAPGPLSTLQEKMKI
jgi:hypothetical protein